MEAFVTTTTYSYYHAGQFIVKRLILTSNAGVVAVVVIVVVIFFLHSEWMACCNVLLFFYCSTLWPSLSYSLDYLLSPSGNAIGTIQLSLSCRNESTIAATRRFYTSALRFFIR